VTFPAGSGDQTTRTVEITVQPDTLREWDETLTLTSSLVSGPGAVGGRTTTTLRITEDERAWIPADSGLQGGAFQSVVVDPADPNIVWVSGQDTNGFGAYRSTDGGTSWLARGIGLEGGA